MKFIVLYLFVIFAVVATNGLPAGGKNKSKASQCPFACTADYSPVCAADPKDAKSAPRLFGNECVLKVHNCEHNSNLVRVDMNKCKGAGGVRLS